MQRRDFLKIAGAAPFAGLLGGLSLAESGSRIPFPRGTFATEAPTVAEYESVYPFRGEKFEPDFPPQDLCRMSLCVPALNASGHAIHRARCVEIVHSDGKPVRIVRYAEPTPARLAITDDLLQRTVPSGAWCWVVFQGPAVVETVPSGEAPCPTAS